MILLLVVLAAAKSGEAVTAGKDHVMLARRADAKGLWVMSGAYAEDPAVAAQTSKALGDALAADGATLEAANAKLLELKLSNRAGAEALIARLEKNVLKVSFVGNLAVLRVRNGVAERATLPHSIIEDFIRTKPDMPETDKEMMRLEAPHRFVTVRSLGKKADTAVETVEVPVVKGDRFVIANIDVLAATPLPEVAKRVGAAKQPDAAAKELKKWGAKARAEGVPTAIVIFAD